MSEKFFSKRKNNKEFLIFLSGFFIYFLSKIFVLKLKKKL